ncbi:MAG: hypothetical protein M1835_006276 [Candelina submexicana]|nr:MAG: hypothetical protein M1835_006276 [Candelina submexicana]
MSLRAGALRAKPMRSATARAYSATFICRNTEKVVQKHIPVTSYTDNEEIPTASTLPVTDAKYSSLPSSVVEAVRRPMPLKSSVVEELPPTLAKFTLHDKVAIVTGAARGLGYSMAQALCEVGVKGIAIIDVQQDLGDAAAAELHEATGVPVKFYKVDVRDANAVSEVVGNVVDTFGSIDILISSAGIADSNIKAVEYDPEMFRRLMDINVTGSFLVAQSCGRAMIRAGKGGSIIFIASMSGSIVNYPQEQSCYNASKAAVIQLSRSLAAEWAQYNIRVNTISPGYMDTALNRVPALDAQKKIWTSRTPQQRLGGQDELNCLAVYLAADGSSFMTGNDCIIDGGYSVY